jgi:hypothetical protein
MLEIEDVAEVIAGAVREATAPLLARIDALERRELLLPEKGEPGVGFANALIDKDGCLVLTRTDGSTCSVGPVVGQDGADGLGPEDMRVARVGERGVEIALVRGEIEHAFEIEFPFPIYRDVYKEGEAYERGDLVTWGGSVWHCDKATNAKPGTDDWTLAVKKGRDGKDAAK